MREEGRRFRVMSARKQSRTERTVNVIFPGEDFRAMAGFFADQERRGYEGYAIALCGHKAGAEKKSVTYMARGVHLPDEGDLVSRSSVSVTPAGEFMERVLAEAALRQSAVLEVHTHPDSASPTFSAVDLEHGLDNGRFLRSCRTRFAMMVLGAAGFAIAEYNPEDDRLQLPRAAAISVMTRAGLRRLMPAAEPPPDAPLPESVDRQVRIWGAGCQRRIATAVVGVVGLGGTGAALLQMLVRMGARRFILCDHDDVESSNLSRLPYVFGADTGKKKTRAAVSYVRKTAADAGVETVNARVQDAPEAFRGCDVLFGCVDNDGARLALNEIALKYYIPYIDTGTEIFVEDGQVRDMGGQVRVVVPAATGCLECAGGIDREAAAADLADDGALAVRQAAGYVKGTGFTPAPAVITLNTIVAAMAAQEFADMMAGRDRAAAPNYLLYDATAPRIERFSFGRNPDCPLCGRHGILGAGDQKRQGRPGIKKISPRPAERL